MIHQIYDIASPDDLHIHRLCTTVLDTIHEKTKLNASFNVITQFQP